MQRHIVRNLLLGSTFLLLIVLGSLCTWQFYPFETPTQMPEELLLSAEDFRENWVTGYLAHGRYEGEYFDLAAAGAAQRYITDTNPNPRRNEYLAAHRVGSFRSFTFAHSSYLSLTENWFLKERTLEGWTIPAELAESDSHADESQRGCAIVNWNFDQPVQLCVVVARYGQYVSEFWFVRDLALLTPEEVQSILAAINSKF